MDFNLIDSEALDKKIIIFNDVKLFKNFITKFNTAKRKIELDLLMNQHPFSVVGITEVNGQVFLKSLHNLQKN
jgi:hypothetical protein